MKLNHDKNKVLALGKKHGWEADPFNEHQNSIIFHKDDYRLTIWLKRGSVAFYIAPQPEFFKRNVDLGEIEEILINSPYEPNKFNGHY